MVGRFVRLGVGDGRDGEPSSLSNRPEGRRSFVLVPGEVSLASGGEARWVGSSRRPGVKKKPAGKETPGGRDSGGEGKASVKAGAWVVGRGTGCRMVGEYQGAEKSRCAEEGGKEEEREGEESVGDGSELERAINSLHILPRKRRVVQRACCCCCWRSKRSEGV